MTEALLSKEGVQEGGQVGLSGKVGFCMYTVINVVDCSIYMYIYKIVALRSRMA